MSDVKVKFGLTLPNRGVIIGATTVPEMLELAELADRNGWDSVWVGDSIFAKPRLDALVLLGALAVRTSRVRLGVACMASMPLRHPLLLAYQWASLDLLSAGRTVLVACQNRPGPGAGDFAHEYEVFGVSPATRSRRMEEAIEILRLTTSRTNVSYFGRYFRFENVTILPQPVQQPVPIWVVANPDLTRPELVARTFRRVARYGDGWMTTRQLPDEFQASVQKIKNYANELGRDLPAAFEFALYYNINVNEDSEQAFAESKRFLDSYYDFDFPPAVVDRWVAYGPPEACIEKLRAFAEAGATTITLRLTAYDQRAQFKRVTDEVLKKLRG